MKNGINLDSVEMSSAILSGNIIASSTIKNTKWGKIIGDINAQTDLIQKLDEKEDSESNKVAVFFNDHPEFDFHFILDMKDQQIADWQSYIDLVVEKRNQNSEEIMSVPYEIGRMCLIVRASSDTPKEVIRFFVPDSGEIGYVDISNDDESGLVRFTYHLIGDDADESAEWGKLLGSIENQSDLMEMLDQKLNKSDFITIEEINSLFAL